MAQEQGKSQNKNQTAGNSGESAGMQVSGQEIFQPEDTQPKVTPEGDVFGDPAAVKQAAADTAAADKETANADAAKAAAAQVGEVLKGNTAGVTDAAKEVFSQAKETVGGVAGSAYEKVQGKAEETFAQQKQTVAQGLGSIAENIRQFSDNLRGVDNPNQFVTGAANYVDPLAAQIENIAHYVEQRDFAGLARDLRGFASRNPTLFVAGAFGVGLFAARFIKSSPRRNFQPGNRGGKKGKN